MFVYFLQRFLNIAGRVLHALSFGASFGAALAFESAGAFGSAVESRPRFFKAGAKDSGAEGAVSSFAESPGRRGMCAPPQGALFVLQTVSLAFPVPHASVGLQAPKLLTPFYFVVLLCEW